MTIIVQPLADGISRNFDLYTTLSLCWKVAIDAISASTEAADAGPRIIDRKQILGCVHTRSRIGTGACYVFLLVMRFARSSEYCDTNSVTPSILLRVTLKASHNRRRGLIDLHQRHKRRSVGLKSSAVCYQNGRKPWRCDTGSSAVLLRSERKSCSMTFPLKSTL